MDFKWTNRDKNKINLAVIKRGAKRNLIEYKSLQLYCNFYSFP